MKSFAIKLSQESIEEIESIARLRYIPARTLGRAWIMERLKEEKMEAKKTEQ
jgi:hypothetical protein